MKYSAHHTHNILYLYNVYSPDRMSRLILMVIRRATSALERSPMWAGAGGGIWPLTFVKKTWMSLPLKNDESLTSMSNYNNRDDKVLYIEQ